MTAISRNCSDDAAPVAMPAILLVDDSEGFRKQLKWTVVAVGYRVTEAGNGEEALEATAGHLFDLIIMNLEMPVLNGFEATKKIRRMSAYGRVPILALTAYDSESAREGAYRAGCTAYFNKLTDIERLITILRGFAR